MKCFFVISALFAAAMAAPAVGDTCDPATYTCALNPSTGAEGWEVCDAGGAWVVSCDASSASLLGPAFSSRDKLLIPVLFSVGWRLPAQHQVCLPPGQRQPVLYPQLKCRWNMAWSISQLLLSTYGVICQRFSALESCF